MQIDFHHGVTFIVARIAGFTPAEAETLAYCAQYVDDATNEGLIRFHNGAQYDHIASAHKALDYSNFEALEQALVWVPFHFLPGNFGRRADQRPRGTYLQRLVTLPNSPVAQDMVRSCFTTRDEPWGLHRLGIAMHTFVDTWAHQGFVGVRSNVNEASDVQPKEAKFKAWGARTSERLSSYFVNRALPLGHGTVLSYPDRPYLRWSYLNHEGQLVERDNPADFIEAADEMCRWLRRWKADDPDAAVPGLSKTDREAIWQRMLRFTSEDEHRRHKNWLKAYEGGKFSVRGKAPVYVGKGTGSWKHEALGTTRSRDKPTDRFPFRGPFMRSNWRMFHDALQAQRLKVLLEVLPRFEICMA